MELEKVFEKLKKLKKLYEGAKAIKSEGEAAAAASAIQRLLIQYNLSMSEIDKSNEEDKHKDDVNKDIVNGFTYKGIGGVWEYNLTYVICKWNFCKCFMYGNTYKKLILLGKKENLEVVEWLRETLSRSFVEISQKRWQEYKKTREYELQYPHISKDRFQRGFLIGCARGLDDKLKEISDRDKKKDQIFGTKVTALVLRNNTAIDEYLNKMGVNIKTIHSTTSAGTHSAREMGYKTGRETDINKPISNQRKNTNNVNLI